MLHDLFMVELYFGPHEAVHNIEDIAKTYGQEAVSAAIEGGFLRSYEPHMNCTREQVCGSRDILCWLSEKGRRRAQIKLLS